MIEDDIHLFFFPHKFKMSKCEFTAKADDLVLAQTKNKTFCAAKMSILPKQNKANKKKIPKFV